MAAGRGSVVFQSLGAVLGDNIRTSEAMAYGIVTVEGAGNPSRIQRRAEFTDPRFQPLGYFFQTE